MDKQQVDIKKLDSMQNNEEETKGDELDTKESNREREIRIKKANANRILHERNIYVFMASVAEDAMNNQMLKWSDIAGFLLVKKLVQMVNSLAHSMSKRENVYKLEL